MSHAPARVVVLGSTGSIGTQALDVVTHLGSAGRAPRVVGLAAGGSRLDLLAEQAVSFAVPRIAVSSSEAGVAARVRTALRAAADRLGRPDPVAEILIGPDSPVELVSRAELAQEDTVVNGITGSVGLGPTLAALATGARLALANKESLVVGGALVRSAARRPGQIVPVDSEHSAIAQALASGRHERGLTSPAVTGRSDVRRLVLTASGGPFRGRSRAELAGVTAEQALAHPTWAMGPVVTVNSSTLVNKGLELIEAQFLFDMSPEQLDVIIHPQSIIHSMVEYVDGSVLAQLGNPDMRVPIAHALAYPERFDSGVSSLDLVAAGMLQFEEPDETRFPCLRLAREAMRAGGGAPCVLNAANEVVNEAFRNNRCAFPDMARTIEATMAKTTFDALPSLEALLQTDAEARAIAHGLLGTTK